MRHVLFAFLIIYTFFITNVYSDAIKKSGFIDPKVKIIKSEEIEDPKNKIIIIYNHGQNSLDNKGKDCTWIGSLRNKASLVNNEVNGKSILVYNLCTNKLDGDEPSNWWGSGSIYKGKTKLDKRVEANLELVEKFVSKGVPRKQIFITGHSCGGLTTLLFLTRHPDKVGGGISYMHACFGKLSNQYKVKKVGVEKALNKFKKKYPGPYELRERQLNEIESRIDMELSEYHYKRESWIEAKSKLERMTNELNEKGGAWAASKQDHISRAKELEIEKQKLIGATKTINEKDILP